jgi:hypothetical protein
VEYGPRPLLKDNEIESKGWHSSSSDVPVSITACHRRAPSRCNLMPCSRANAAISRMSDCGKIVPLSVFSREMTRVGALVLSTGLVRKVGEREQAYRCTSSSRMACFLMSLTVRWRPIKKRVNRHRTTVTLCLTVFWLNRNELRSRKKRRPRCFIFPDMSPVITQYTTMLPISAHESTS